LGEIEKGGKKERSQKEMRGKGEEKEAEERKNSRS